jgi:DnaJ-class molecular chaperone
VIFEIKINDHKDFKRKGADLMLEKDITLYEALTGVAFSYQHLDGRKVQIVSEPGKIIKPGDIKTIEDLGMPLFKNPYKFGNLFVSFSIDFPDVIQPVSNLVRIQEVIPFSFNLSYDNRFLNSRNLQFQWRKT